MIRAAQDWMAAPHGGKRPIVAALAESLDCSYATAYRRLRDVTVFRRPRKRRHDARSSALTQEEASLISGYLMESRRRTGKFLSDLEAAVETLRANEKIVAGHVDQKTGEFQPLSLSAINRALKVYRCHPGQLSQPTPKINLRSEHPNHCWQIDPSLCVLYYLRREAGLRTMPADEFYKNKPANLARIENDRVWRYVIVDHTSGAFYVEYVLGAESGKSLCDSAIHAMQPRGAEDPFCGVPKLVMVDPGSANKSAMFRNLCASLGIDIWVNQPKQPWAKGSVEKHNDIIECEFEHRLMLHRVKNLDELNAAAWRWSRQFQARTVHSRHGMTRYAAWKHITPNQLRIPPAEAVCRSIAMAAPVERKVDVHLRVHWRGRHYDVSDVPGVIVGQKLTLARNAWDDENTAHVLGVDEAGYPKHYVVPVRARGDYGFFDDAVPLGQFRQHAATPADVNRKAIERLAMEADTDAEAAAKRKAGELPFGGRIDPYREIEQLPEVAWLPSRGTPVEVNAPQVIDLTQPREPFQYIKNEFPPLNHFEAAKRIEPLLERRGLPWRAEMYQAIVKRWPDGLPYDQVEEWAESMFQRFRLRAVDTP